MAQSVPAVGRPHGGDQAAKPPLGARFWRLFTSSAMSNLADGGGQVVLPLVAAAISRDPVAVSAVVALNRLPWLLFALPGGAIADRVDRRLAMTVANAVRAALYLGLGLAALGGLLGMALLYVVTFTLALAEIVYDSSARAILPMVVDRPGLDRANGWLTVEENVGQDFVGAPLATALFGLAVALPLIGNGVWFAVAALLVLGLRGSYQPVRLQKTTFRRDLAEGITWLWRQRLLRGLVVATCMTATFAAMASGIMVLYALTVLGISEAVFGLLMTGGAVGGLLGGLLAARVVTRFGRLRTLVLAATVAPAALILLGRTDSPWTAALLLAGSAAGITIWNVVSMSLRQMMIPAELMGRTMAAYRMVIWGGIPLGALAGGALASATSIPTVFVVAGTAQVPVIIWLGTLLHRHGQQIEDAYVTG
jgi:MFS family permease